MDTSLETDVVNGLFGVYDRAIQFNVNKFTKESIIRSYYAEVVQNLEFIDTLNLDAINTLEKCNGKLSIIVNNFDTTMASLILYNGKGREWKSVYKEFQEAQTEQVDEDDKKTTVKIFASMMFTVRKISILKKIASFSELQDIVPNVRIGKRIKNIKDNLIEIRKTLKNMSVIDDFIAN